MISTWGRVQIIQVQLLQYRAWFVNLTTTQPVVAGPQPSAIEISRHICWRVTSDMTV